MLSNYKPLSLFPLGTTNTAQAIQTARNTMFTPENGDRAGFSDTLVIFTDGGSTDFAQTIEEARITKLDGITVRSRICISSSPPPNK